LGSDNFINTLTRKLNAHSTTKEIPRRQRLVHRPSLNGELTGSGMSIDLFYDGT
jgi:hypothetical protein